MTQIAEEQRQTPATSGSLLMRLASLNLNLTAGEQQALDAALRSTGVRREETRQDTGGYLLPAVSLPLIAVKIIEQLRQQPAQGAQQR
jgi:hypothetical protein